MKREVYAAGLWQRLETTRERTVAFDQWLRSPWYIVTMAVLTAISNLLGLDLLLYSLIMLLGYYVCLCSSDLLPLVPLCVLCYVAPSRENNPGRYPGSIFYPLNGGIYLGILFVLFAGCLVWRLVKDPEMGGKKFLQVKRCLMPSMLFLGASYLLSGMGVDEYFSIIGKNLVFALIQCFAVTALYWLFAGAIRWEKAPRDYLAWSGMVAGFVVLVQLAENYLSGRIFENGTLDRELIATGWGMHNNVGCMMAMTMPFAFYLASVNKRGWIFNLLGTVLFLGASYLLSGMGVDEYFSIIGKNLVFALIQCFAVTALYWLFAGAIRWEKAPRDYLAWSGMVAGFVVLVQLAENYLSGRIFENGTLDRELIATGWGMHNNVGCMMAMTMPFAFYLASVNKRGWIFNLLGTVLFLGTVLSCSRGSMLMAGGAYCICAFLLLKNPESRRQNLWVYLGAIAVVVIAVVLLAPKLLKVFRLFISQLDNVSQRDKLLNNGISQFLTEPVFGGSFFPQGTYKPWDWANLDSFSSFFPPRWHNTLVQMFASCGTVGITAYLIHRWRTIQLFWRRRSVEHTYLALSLGVLLCAALLDCHFFNVGPVLFYSMALAFAEKLPEVKKTEKKPGKKILQK